MAGYTLLTGATGLVGRYLLKDLLGDDLKLAVIVRPSRKMSSEERIESIMQMWEKQLEKTLPRPIVLNGDITQPLLGLSEADQYWAAQNCDRFLHSAAILQFHGTDRNAEPWRSNLNGTLHALELCRETSIHDFHYISTAYVCGKRPGPILESELDVGQEFRNEYEHSKMLAEKAVRDADFLEHLTVYRPAVVAGDSVSGYTNTYHGIYMYLKLMSVLVKTVEPDDNGVRHTPVRLPMNGDEPRNIIPVDWVSAVIARLFQMPEAIGKTFHLAPSHCLTARDVIDAGYAYFNSAGVRFANDPTQTDSSKSGLEQWLTQEFTANSQIYESYAQTDPEYDTTNTDALIKDLPCPVIDQAMLHRFLRYGEEDRWGKRPERKPQVAYWVQDVLINDDSNELVLDFKADTLSENYPSLGLDITGPGGCQLTLQSHAGKYKLTMGLPTDDVPIIKVESEELQRLAEIGDLTTASDIKFSTTGLTNQRDLITHILVSVSRQLLLQEPITTKS